MRRRLSTALILVGICTVAAAAILSVDASAQVRPGSSKERRFWSAREGVGVDVPSGWTLSLHTGYANILCSILHPGGSRISLAVDRTDAADASALVAESKAGLTAQGIVVDRVSPGIRNGQLVDARVPRRKQALRQLYLVRAFENEGLGRQAIVVTLTAPADQLASVSGAFDWVLGHLALETPVRPPEAKPDAGR
jgi:hypothetical protein